MASTGTSLPGPSRLSVGASPSLCMMARLQSSKVTDSGTLEPLNFGTLEPVKGALSVEIWVQTYTPLCGALGVSALVAAIPILVLFVMLGVLRKAAWMAATAALASAFV